MVKAQNFTGHTLPEPLSLIALTSLLSMLVLFSAQQSAYGIGFISHHSPDKLPAHWQHKAAHSGLNHKTHHKYASKKHSPKHLAKSTPVPVKAVPVCPENLVANLQSKQILPGVIYKKGNGALRLNILDIDTVKAPVVIKPIIAPQGSSRLKTVKEYTSANNALAAINANYFKKTGVPLGTLIINGDWVAGPLYDRVALGISKSGFVRIDRVGLGGTLYTSNKEIPQFWINNINVPRRTGCRTVAYTRRWGSFVRLPYDGVLVSIDAQGRVMNTNKREMTIPYGGMVITGSADSPLTALKAGDETHLRWQVTPNSWDDIGDAVSGGPMLIKDNSYCINLKAEAFHSNWTSNSIKARTACGVTANNHLILVTAEGTHTLYDLAHILHELGAVDAMNLDGGGSTTMVIHDTTMNMENKSNERKVAVALGIFVLAKENANPTPKQTSSKPTITAERLLENLPVAN